MKEKKEILITEEGIRVHGFEEGSPEIIAVLVEALCYSWRKEIGEIDIEYAGKKVIDALGDAERDYRINVIYELLMEDEEDGD